MGPMAKFCLVGSSEKEPAVVRHKGVKNMQLQLLPLGGSRKSSSVNNFCQSHFKVNQTSEKIESTCGIKSLFVNRGHFFHPGSLTQAMTSATEVVNIIVATDFTVCFAF